MKPEVKARWIDRVKGVTGGPFGSVLSSARLRALWAAEQAGESDADADAEPREPRKRRRRRPRRGRCWIPSPRLVHRPCPRHPRQGERPETETTAAQDCPACRPCPGTESIRCGNRRSGIGMPGERQVNSPAQDRGVGNRITQSETSLAAFGSYILMGFNDSNCVIPGKAPNFSGFAFSSDGGQTWCDCGSMPLLPGGQNTGDPVVAVDSQGIFYYAHLGTLSDGEDVIQLNTAAVDPDTRTLTISPSQVIGVGERSDDLEDKEWITVGPDPSRPGKEALYVTWSDFAPDQTTVRLRFTKLSTGRRPRVLIPPTTIDPGAALGSFPVVDACGNLYVFYEDFGSQNQPKTIRMLKSTDGGQTFGPQVVISAVETAGERVCGNFFGIALSERRKIRLTEFPHAAADPEGNLYVVWNDGRNPGAIAIFLAYSTDGGESWSVRQVTRRRRHSFIPSVAADWRGAHIQYSQFCGHQGPTGDGTFALFMKSFTIGEGFGWQERVSTVCSPVPRTEPNFDPAFAGCYMGDYNQIITGPQGSLLHAWSDNRRVLEGNRNPDLFFIQSGPGCRHRVRGAQPV